MSRVAQVAAATPAHRDRYIDFLRVASLGGVIFGHFMMSVVVLGDQAGEAPFSFTNILSVEPWTRWGTWILQVMPVFFVVGGFAHAKSWRSLQAKGGGYADFVRARVVRLVRPAVVFVAVWFVISAIAESVSDGALHVMQVLALGGQVLWFLGIYLMVAALTPPMLALHERFHWRVPAVLFVAVATVDWLRHAAEFTPTMWFNFAFVWLAIHQCGFFYADGVIDRLGAKRTGTGLLTVGLLSCMMLIARESYSHSMVTYPGDPNSNMVPPSLALLMFAVAQMGLLLLLRGPITSLLQRSAVWKVVIVGGSVAMTAYLWHFTALIAMYAGLFALGFTAPFPDPTTSTWWWWRVPLGILFLVLVAVLIAIFSRFEAPPRAAELVGHVRSRSILAAAGATCGIVGMMGFASVGFRGVLSFYVARVGPLPITSVIAMALVMLSALLTWLAVRSRATTDS